MGARPGLQPVGVGELAAAGSGHRPLAQLARELRVVDGEERDLERLHRGGVGGLRPVAHDPLLAVERPQQPREVVGVVGRPHEALVRNDEVGLLVEERARSRRRRGRRTSGSRASPARVRRRRAPCSVRTAARPGSGTDPSPTVPKTWPKSSSDAGMPKSRGGIEEAQQPERRVDAEALRLVPRAAGLALEQERERAARIEQVGREVLDARAHGRRNDEAIDGRERVDHAHHHAVVEDRRAAIPGLERIREVGRRRLLLAQHLGPRPVVARPIRAPHRNLATQSEQHRDGQRNSSHRDDG